MNAVLFGATGMVGIEGLHACLDDVGIERVVSIGRRSTEVVHPKYREALHHDFANFDHYIFRPGYIAPGRRKGRSRIPDWLARPVYRLIPSIGIDAVDLARVMLRTGLGRGEKRLFLNREIRELIPATSQPRDTPS